MKSIHVECLPDELLVSKLGFTKRFITHHQGKARVFHALGKGRSLLAVVDEDPGSVKSKYESNLILVNQFEGIFLFKDRSENKVIVLKGKLEDWVISICRKNKINIGTYNLPGDPDDLHDVINQRLNNFSRLLDFLLNNRNPEILKLKEWLV